MNVEGKRRAGAACGYLHNFLLLTFLNYNTKRLSLSLSVGQ